MRRTVRFADGVSWLRRRGVASLLELGPDGVLSAMSQECIAAEQGPREAPVAALPVLRAERPERETLLAALGSVWVRGVGVEWAEVFRGTGAARVRLPTYAFQRRRYWLDAPRSRAGDLAAAGQRSAEHPLLSAVLPLADGEGWLLTGCISLQVHPWIGDHAVNGVVLLSGTTLVELALCAGAQGGCELLEELVLEAPLVLPERGGVQIQVSLGEPDEAGGRPVSIHSRPEAAGRDAADSEQAWVRHAGGRMLPGGDRGARAAALEGGWPPVGSEAVGVEDLYLRLAERGFDYGPVFQGVRAGWRRGEEIFAEVSLPAEQLEQAGRFNLHPALLDAAFHVLLAADGEADRPRLPFSWSGVGVELRGVSTLRARFCPEREGGVAVTLFDEHDAHVGEMRSVVGREVSTEQLAAARGGRQDSLFRLDWVELPRSSRAAEAAAERWAVLDAGDSDLAACIEAAGCAAPQVFADAESLGAAVDRGADVPQVALVDFRGVSADGARDVPARARDALQRGLALVRSWLADERLSALRLVFVTEQAVSRRRGPACKAWLRPPCGAWYGRLDPSTPDALRWSTWLARQSPGSCWRMGSPQARRSSRCAGARCVCQGSPGCAPPSGRSSWAGGARC